MTSAAPAEVLDFWFGALSAGFADDVHERRWFTPDPAFDAEVRRRFASVLARAAEGGLDAWRGSPRDTLALVVVCDQFSRHVHRGTREAYATDLLALSAASDAVARGEDRRLSSHERAFLYMPFQHSESRLDQHTAVGLFSALRDATPAGMRQRTGNFLRHAQQHRGIVLRFGRFPHRNAVLGRESTPAELEFLATASDYGQSPRSPRPTGSLHATLASYNQKHQRKTMEFDIAMTDELLATTRAVRKRLDLGRPVPREVIEECLALAVQAPTGSNSQTWRWVVVDDAGKRKGLADLYRKSADAYLKQAGAEAEQRGDAQTGRVFDSAVFLAEHLHEVPVHLIPCVQGRPSPETPPAMLAGLYGSIFPAVWSFQLALRARGLGSTLTTLHLAYEREAAELLGLPDTVLQVGLLPVGYTVGTDFKRATRPPVSTITHWNGW